MDKNLESRPDMRQQRRGSIYGHPRNLSAYCLFEGGCIHNRHQPVQGLRRSKIYGVLGIANTAFVARIQPDSSIPVEDVYKDAFSAHLQSTSRLEFLKHCNLMKREIGGSTWVPDWSRTEFTPPYSQSSLAVVCPKRISVTPRPGHSKWLGGYPARY